MPLNPLSEYPINYDCSNGIATITLNRPDRLNATTPGLFNGIRAGLVAATDDDADVVVLTGAGRAFCAGGDLTDQKERNRSQREERAFLWTIQEACKAIQLNDVPVLAQVHGYAIGGGLEIALSADIIVAAVDTEFRFPEVTLGTYVTGGCVYLLPQRVGIGLARELVMTGRWVTDQEALDIGLIDHLVPEGELSETVLDLAQTIQSNATLAVRFAKDHFSAIPYDRYPWLSREVNAALACKAQPDWNAGLDSFTTT